MFSFEGNYRQKRVQTFDRNEKITAADIVRQTRDERKKRELVRMQNLAATKIQASIRGMLSRSETRRIVSEDFNHLVKQLQDVATQDSVESPQSSQSLARLLGLCNWYCRTNVDRDSLFATCRILMSKFGRANRNYWMSLDGVEPRLLLGRTLRVVLRYLNTLLRPASSADYSIPVRLLEDTVSPSDDFANLPPSVIRNRVWLYQYLGRNHYFRTLARFIDGQLPSTAGFLSESIDSNTTVSIFDPVEYNKIPQVRELSTLMWGPIVWIEKHVPVECGSSTAVSEYSQPHVDLVTLALNDLLVSQGDQFQTTERIVRGICAGLLELPSTVHLISRICLSWSNSSNSPALTALVPSLNLLYLLTTVVVPRLSGMQLSPTCDRLSTPPRDHHSNDSTEENVPVTGTTRLQPTSSLSGSVASELVRATAWLLLQALQCPSLACIRPVCTPLPLTSSVTPDDMDSSEDDEMDIVGILSEIYSTVTDPVYGEKQAYVRTWPSQISEVLVALRQILPTLASAALSTFPTGCTQHDAIPAETGDLVCSLAHLHYALSQVYGLPNTKMIALNSIYSRDPLFIRALWHLIQQSEVNPDLSRPVQTNHGSNLFRSLSVGELPERVTDLQSYLPLLFTFVDCLHHRLMCLTDDEISGTESPPNCSSLSPFGCGFHSAELRHVASRLIDLMLGLIELSHPDQLPRYKPPRESYSDFASKRKAYREVFDRLEKLAEIGGPRGSMVSSAARLQESRWSPGDLRIQLHCWTELFQRVQRLVFQIYDWDRRCHRRLTLDPGVSADVFANHSTWVKPNIANSVDAIVRSWLQHDNANDFQLFASLPFGYFSVLNPDKDEANIPSYLSNSTVRQLLILKELPFVIPFDRRVRLFKAIIDSSRSAVQGARVPNITDYYQLTPQRPSISILVRRTHLYEDAFEKLSKENEPDLKINLRVRFMNQVGVEEAGIDGGGLSREFLSEVLLDGFDPNRGFFVYSADQTLYPNPEAAVITEDYLKHYYFLGRMVAKAIYEGLLVELRFAHFFLAKIVSRCGGGVGFDYLHSLDPELYRQLSYLKTYTDDVRNLMLDFTVVQSTFGDSKVMELKPDGRHIAVTNENRVEYVHLMAHYKLNRQIYPHTRAFIAGLNDVINIELLCLFDATELQTLISGADTPIDIDDLERHTVYSGRSENQEETIKFLWTVLRAFSEQDKRRFLRFVTACSRPPMFGFRDLLPPFTIQITDDVERLPTASTCINTLRLPNYRDANVIRERLLYALRSNCGFEYS